MRRCAGFFRGFSGGDRRPVAAAVAEAAVVGVAAVGCAVMGVPAGEGAVFVGAQSPAGAVAEAAVVVIAAVASAIVGVPAGGVAVPVGTQSPAGAVADAALMGIAAVDHAAVEMAAGDSAVGIGADGHGGLKILPVSAVVPPAPSAVTAVGRRGHNQRGCQHGAQQTGFLAVGVLETMLLAASLTVLLRLPAPERPEKAEPAPAAAALLEPLRNRRFRRVMLTNMVWSLSGMFIGGFAAVYQIQVLELTFFEIMVWVTPSL